MRDPGVEIRGTGFEYASLASWHVGTETRIPYPVSRIPYPVSRIPYPVSRYILYV